MNLWQQFYGEDPQGPPDDPHDVAQYEARERYHNDPGVVDDRLRTDAFLALGFFVVVETHPFCDAYDSIAGDARRLVQVCRTYDEAQEACEAKICSIIDENGCDETWYQVLCPDWFAPPCPEDDDPHPLDLDDQLQYEAYRKYLDADDIPF